MRRVLALLSIALGLGLVGGSAAGGEVARPSWQIHDLGAVRPLGMDDAAAINERGEIVGRAGAVSVLWTGHNEIILRSIDAAAVNDAGTVVGTTRAMPPHAAMWRDGKVTDLGVLRGGDSSEAEAINDRGEIAGRSRTRHDESGYHVVVWSAGRMHDLGAAPSPRPGAVPVVAALTNDGDVVGSAGTDALTASGRVITSYPFLWRAGRMIAIGGGARQGDAVGEDAAGDVAGTWWQSQLRRQAFLWRNGRAVLLGGVPGCANSQSVAIAKSGDVLVECDPGDASGRFRAFVWSHGRRTDLGTLSRGGTITANAIGDDGSVVGYADDAPITTRRHAFVWRRGRMTDLGTLGGDESEALAVNDAGVIIGTSTTRSGAHHAVFWTPRR